MSNEKKVSVIIPVYNGESTIDYAIKSLLYQSYTNWECIIVNDGSTDNTLKIIEKYLIDSRFILVNFEKNRGRPYARQEALDRCTGKYIALLDADDFYHPNKLERQVNTFISNPSVSLVSSGMCSFGINSNILVVRCKGDNKIIKYKKGIQSPVAHAASMLVTEIAQKYKYNTKLKLAQDVDYLSRYLENREYIVTNDVLYYYSEFDSVTLTKILKGYYYCIIKSIKSISESPIFFTKYILINFIKITIGAIYYPIIGIENVLKRRGIKPNNIENEEFLEFKKTLNI